MPFTSCIFFLESCHLQVRLSDVVTSSVTLCFASELSAPPILGWLLKRLSVYILLLPGTPWDRHSSFHFTEEETEAGKLKGWALSEALTSSSLHAPLFCPSVCLSLLFTCDSYSLLWALLEGKDLSFPSFSYNAAAQSPTSNRECMLQRSWNLRWRY